MRFIDLAFAEMPENYNERAARAFDDGPDKINDHSVVWRDCKDNLKSVSNGKCFYCEVREPRSDGAVDHYRPKSIYSWAAFRFSNFRFSCTFCNSLRKDKKTGETGGKGDSFPLCTGCHRATCEAEESNELPALLDPCKAGDPLAIEFTTDGRVIPKYSDENDVRKMRGEISIKAYHLNHSALIEERRQHSILLKEKIIAACHAERQCAAGDLASKASFDDAVAYLHRAIQPKAQFSAYAKRVLQRHKENPLIDAILASS
ncbi:hypothetical protein ACT3S8_15455 [Halomonas sp. AOP42-D2-25]|uniref:hypothetical protein n=1 Tax=unclassified Halomonas TaxID=2609666 RepID=UPI003F905F23